jgi:hypothetical protein
LQAILTAVYLNKQFGAVRAGFEPAVRFKGVRQFSKLLLSASQAPHLKTEGKNRWKNAIDKLVSTYCCTKQLRACTLA